MLYLQYFQIVLFSLIFNFQTIPVTKSSYTKLDSILTEYDTQLENFISENQVPGYAVAIVINDRIEYIKGFGVTKMGETDSVDIQSVFRIASVSKGFASVLTGLLVHNKILNWDDKIKKHLPDFELKDSTTTQELTIHHILSHTSGLTPHAYDNLIEADFPFTKIVDRLKEVNVHCPPGDCYGYQNTVYSLIAPIIESATGKSYEELLKEKVTNPLGMKNVSFNQEDMTASQHQTFPHVRRQGKWVAKEIRESYYNVPPAAGVNASIYDMAYWLRALMGGQPEIIPPSVIQKVSKPVISTPREKYRYNTEKRIKYAAYGLGWRIFDYAGYTMIFHSGGMRGYLAKLAFFPKHKMGIVVLQNARFGNNFLYKFIDLYFGIESEPIVKKDK